MHTYGINVDHMIQIVTLTNFFDNEKEEYINKILTKGWMQPSIVQRGYVHPRCSLSTKSITSKEY